MARQRTRVGPVDRLLQSFTRSLTPAAARRIVGFRADATTESRIRELAEKCNEGDLTAEERREYERYVRDINFISTLQSQARRVLTRRRKSG